MNSLPSTPGASGETGSPGCAPSILSIPNDPFYIEPACRYAAEVARQIGFDALDQQHVSTGLHRALTTLLRYSFDPHEPGSVELVSERIPAGLKLALRDRGLPLKAPDPGADDAGAGNPLYGLNEHFDEVRFHNRGREGKEIVLSKHLPDPSITDAAAVCSWEAGAAADAGRPEAPSPTTCTVRPLQPSDAHEVSKAVYQAYGYSYPHDYVYYPEKIVELNRRGDIFSAVAWMDGQEMAGHCSLQRWAENPGIAELTQGVVKPRFRSQGCFARLTEYLIETARHQGLIGVFGEAVTTHRHSQKTALHFGLRDCALFLGLIPAAAEFKGLGGRPGDRGSMLVQFRYLTAPAAAPIYPPDAHRAMIAAIFANLGRAADLTAPPPGAERPSAAETGIAVTLSRSLNLARIRVDRYGRNALEFLRGQVRALCRQKWDVIHLLLDLSDPATAHFGARFEELGFFFAGVLPSGLPDGDALILQYLNNFAVAYESLQTESEFAARLAAYVRQRDPSLS
jgi:serine/threonine-protein kinase RsbW